jgi:sulfatase maturation enzyme AslB (radical SAM superfamily)
VLTACELFASGACNLNCTYCYIPKVEYLSVIHKKIIQRIEDGSYLNDLIEIFGEDLEHLSHWGTEPTLTTKYFDEFYKQAFKVFPKLRRVFISSNFMAPPKNILHFINDILKGDGRRFAIEVQVSLDGPAWITDANRMGGSAQKIVSNLLEVLKGLASPHDISFHFKPTITAEQVQKLQDLEVLTGYYDFFDDVMSKVHPLMKSPSHKFQMGADPTLVIPHGYTTEDGIAFAKMYDGIMHLRASGKYKAIAPPMMCYYYRMEQKFPYFREFFTNSHMFNCSAGDTSIGIGDTVGSIHPCHRSFYVHHPDFPTTNKEKILNELSVANTKDDSSIVRAMYINRGYQDFAQFRISNQMTLLYEMARIGQVSKAYLVEDMRLLLAAFAGQIYCPLDNVALCGEQTVAPASYYRVLGNGAFEKLLRHYLNVQKERSGHGKDKEAKRNFEGC